MDTVIAKAGLGMQVTALVLALSAYLGAYEGISRDRVIELTPDATLTITYNDFGTRSEGQTGKLVLKGKEVAGKEGQTLTVGEVELKYYPEAAPQAWMPKAWNYADASLIKYSWQR